MAIVWKFGADVDTDQIVPGRYAPYMTSEEALRSHVFIEARPDFAERVRPGDIIVAGGTGVVGVDAHRRVNIIILVRQRQRSGGCRRLREPRGGSHPRRHPVRGGRQRPRALHIQRRRPRLGEMGPDGI